MKFIPLYRVHKENHNPQYFNTKEVAQTFAEEKDAEIDIIYKLTVEECSDCILNQEPW